MLSPLWESFKKLRKAQEDDLFDLLAKIPIFDGLSKRGIMKIESLCHTRQYKEDEHIFRAGEPGVGMYIVVEGTVEIYHVEKSHKRIIASLEPGDFFGELALLEDLPRTASAQAKSYTKILGFFRPDLMSLVSRKPKIASTVFMNMSKMIGLRLVNANDRLEKLEIHLEQLNDKKKGRR